MVTFIRLMLNEVFTDNSFEQNRLLEKDKIINDIKKKIGISDKPKIRDKVDILYNLCNGIIMNIEEEHNILNLENLYDLFNIDQNNKNNLDNIELADLLMIAETLTIIYGHFNEQHIKKEIDNKYEFLMDVLCCKILRILHKFGSKKIINYSDILSSIQYYRKHKITSGFDLGKSGINQLLNKKEIDNIEQLKKLVNDIGKPPKKVKK